MPERVFDAEGVQRVFADASMGGIYARPEYDLAAMIADRRNHAFLGAHGATVFVRDDTQDGSYSILVGFLPDGRGAWGARFFRDCLDAMFTAGAETLTGYVQAGRLEPIGLALSAGRGARIDRQAAFSVCRFDRPAWLARVASWV